jgi:FKBP-type peptidyl-prolyl cis-trans isomerase FkpA
MKLLTFILLLALSVTQCQNKPDSKSASKVPSEADLIEMNRSLISKDQRLIKEYMSKSDRTFRETGTGMWYSIISAGDDEKINTGDNVTFSYECSLIDGSACYNGSRTLKVGFADAGSGVTEGLQLMGRGSDFIFIIPPYLAYGITGDGNKIPGRAILIYRIRIEEVN